MNNYHGDVNEKLLELQEAMQKMQLLKQIGADRLIIRQENEIFNIQQDILSINKSTSVDIVDMVLPNRCRFCTDKKDDEEKLECYEANYNTCDKKEPAHVSLVSMSILKVTLMYISVLLVLFTFLLLTNIFFNYVDDRLIVFIISSAVVAGIVMVFWKPVKSLLAVIA